MLNSLKLKNRNWKSFVWTRKWREKKSKILIHSLIRGERATNSNWMPGSVSFKQLCENRLSVWWFKKATLRRSAALRSRWKMLLLKRIRLRRALTILPILLPAQTASLQERFKREAVLLWGNSRLLSLVIMNSTAPLRHWELLTREVNNNLFKFLKLSIQMSLFHQWINSNSRLVQRKRFKSFKNWRKNSKCREGNRRLRLLQSKTRKIVSSRNLNSHSKLLIRMLTSYLIRWLRSRFQSKTSLLECQPNRTSPEWQCFVNYTFLLII